MPRDRGGDPRKKKDVPGMSVVLSVGLSVILSIGLAVSPSVVLQGQQYKDLKGRGLLRSLICICFTD